MNVYTRQDLSVMQAWPLERKIRVTQAKILEWYHPRRPRCKEL